MNSLLIELEPNEKLYLELNDCLLLEKFIKEISDYITGIHVYIKDTYYFMDMREEKDNNFLKIVFPQGSRIILENRDKKSKFNVHVNAIIKDVDTIEHTYDYKNKQENFDIKELKILDIPYEKQLLFIKNIDKIKKRDFTQKNELLLTKIGEWKY